MSLCQNNLGITFKLLRVKLFKKISLGNPMNIHYRVSQKQCCVFLTRIITFWTFTLARTYIIMVSLNKLNVCMFKFVQLFVHLFIYMYYCLCMFEQIECMFVYTCVIIERLPGMYIII